MVTVISVPDWTGSEVKGRSKQHQRAPLLSRFHGRRGDGSFRSLAAWNGLGLQRRDKKTLCKGEGSLQIEMTRSLERYRSKAQGLRTLWVVNLWGAARIPRVSWKTEKLFGSMVLFRMRHRKHVVSKPIAYCLELEGHKDTSVVVYRC